jgi:hypothetical protein
MSVDVLALVPVNGTAAKVVSQKGAAPSIAATRDDLVHQLAMLRRRRDDLKAKLGIANKCQHKNLMARFNKKTRKVGRHPQWETLQEYVATGESIRRIELVLEND